MTENCCFDVSLENRLDVIRDTFVEAYFGHVQVSMAIWNELETYCQSYLAASQRTTKNGVDHEANLQKLKNLFDDILSQHPLNEFPVSNKLKRNVLKWINKLFNLATELSSECDECEPEYIFKSFCRFGPHITLLEENRDLIGHGTTGLTSWQGALITAEWAQNYARLFDGKKVLELGSGAGLLGLSLIKTLNTKSYVFTDCHFKVLNSLIYNVNLNTGEKPAESLMRKATEFGPPTKIKESMAKTTSFHRTLDDGREISVRNLDWVHFDENSFKNEVGNVDIVIGSDIVYERSLLPHLCKVVKCLLGDFRASCAIIACTERSFTTLNCFEEELKKQGLNFGVIHKAAIFPSESILSSDVQHQATRIYKVEDQRS